VTEQQADAAYDVLVNVCGAREEERVGFVWHHAKAEPPCREWRFCGSLGFGGKYLSYENRVDCYIKDASRARHATIKRANDALAELAKRPASHHPGS
jgi:hypothetical protein